MLVTEMQYRTIKSNTLRRSTLRASSSHTTPKRAIFSTQPTLSPSCCFTFAPLPIPSPGACCTRHSCDAFLAPRIRVLGWKQQQQPPPDRSLRAGWLADDGKGPNPGNLSDPPTPAIVRAAFAADSSRALVVSRSSVEEAWTEIYDATFEDATCAWLECRGREKRFL